MSKTRTEYRISNGAINVYGADLARGPISTTTVVKVIEKTAAGAWREVFFAATGESAGYQVVPLAARVRVMPRLQHSLTITLKELQRNAGLFGLSQTKGRSESYRLQRHAKYDKDNILAPEDAIERAIAKVRLWPYPASRIDDGTGTPVYGDKAIRCYPHTK